MKDLTPQQKKHFIRKSHELHPVVMIGNKGLTETVNKEIDIALSAHELIKIKIAGADRDQRTSLIETIGKRHHAILIQQIGMVGIFYRKNEIVS